MWWEGGGRDRQLIRGLLYVHIWIHGHIAHAPLKNAQVMRWAYGRTWLAWTHQAEVTILAFHAAERHTVMHPAWLSLVYFVDI